MSFVFWQHPPVVLLFLLTVISAVFAARLRRAVPLPGALCVVCTVAMLLTALACSVPYEEILLLLSAELLLFFALAREGRA